MEVVGTNLVTLMSVPYNVLKVWKKIRRNPYMKTQYAKFVAEYISLNHMSLISSQVSQKTYFIPHHRVYKLGCSSTKLGAVFMVLQNQQPSCLLTIFCIPVQLYSHCSVHFCVFDASRWFLVETSARCIGVRVCHPNNYLQCILWRESEDDIKTY